MIDATEIAAARAAAGGRRLVDVLEERLALGADEFAARLAATFRLEPLRMDDLRRHDPAVDLVPFAECSPGSFTRVVRKLSGIADFHPHRMRHTFACSWLEQGGSLAALQQVLGHASIVTTQRYARLTDDHVMSERLRMARSATK